MTLLWGEHKKLIQTVVEVVNHRVPVFTGTTSLNTRRIIEKTRGPRDVGSDGVLNGVPMWLQSSVENAVQCYVNLAEACPAMAIMIYHNPPAFRVTIPPAAFKQLGKVRNIVAVKQAVTELNQLMATIRACGDEISVLMSDRCCFPAMKFGARGEIDEAALWAGQRWAELGEKYRAAVERSPAGVA